MKLVVSKDKKEFYIAFDEHWKDRQLDLFEKGWTWGGLSVCISCIYLTIPHDTPPCNHCSHAGNSGVSHWRKRI